MHLYDRLVCVHRAETAFNDTLRLELIMRYVFTHNQCVWPATCVFYFISCRVLPLYKGYITTDMIGQRFNAFGLKAVRVKRQFSQSVLLWHAQLALQIKLTV